jgi:peptide chain release factor subunit 1
MLTAETIDRITHFDSHGLPVVSVYMEIPVDVKDRAAIHGKAVSLLQRLEPLAEGDTLDHDAQQSVRGDIRRIGEAVTEERLTPGGMAFFSCSGADLYEEVALPRAVPDRVMVDETPWVRPMLAVLDEYLRAGIVIVDRADAQLWELYQDELAEDARLTDRKLRTTSLSAAAGWRGWREPEIQRKGNELAKKHFRHVVDVLQDRADDRRYDVLMVGGHAEQIPGFLDHLPRELRERVIGTFVVDPDTVDRGVIRSEAGRLLERYQRDRERQRVAEVLERAAEHKPAAIGVPACLWAGSMAAVQTLLVQDGAVVPGVACDNCGWLGLAGEACPVCSSHLRQTPDVLDELVQAVIEESGTVEHVVADTPLTEHVAIASLRFPVPPEPERTTSG